jgi:hypothetical protein
MTLRPGPTTGHKPLSVSRYPTIGIGIRTYEILHLAEVLVRHEAMPALPAMPEAVQERSV